MKIFLRLWYTPLERTTHVFHWKGAKQRLGYSQQFVADHIDVEEYVVNRDETVCRVLHARPPHTVQTQCQYQNTYQRLSLVLFLDQEDLFPGLCQFNSNQHLLSDTHHWSYLGTT